jgi:Na+/H+ antiporter NhaD/arsenite permease-like protein/mannitol/fructose-specific phosphotransferase system IIA component (Ntr-type)
MSGPGLGLTGAGSGLVSHKDNAAVLKLASLVRPELAFDAPAVTGRRELLEFLADRLVEQGLISRPTELVDEFLQREDQGSTGVGHGIAIPHAMHAPLDRILVAVVRLAAPLDWQAVDSEPVRLVVAIVAPEGDRELYLDALAEVARSLHQPEVRDASLRARDAARIAAIISRPPHESFLMRNRRLLLFALLVAGVFLLSRLAMNGIRLPSGGIYEQLDYLRFNNAFWLFRQQLTLTLFVAMVLGTLLFWRYRVAIAAASLGVLLVAGVMDIETTVRFMSIPTVLFIMSMMVIVKWLENIGVFRYIVVKAIERVGGVPWLLLLLLMGFSVLLGGFTGEVSAILVTFPLALEVSRRTRTPIVPYLLSLVFATNVGSALTLVGNPIGVYIAFAGRLNFEDFLRWATPIATLAGLVVTGLCLLVYRRHFFVRSERTDLHDMERTMVEVDPRRMRIGIATFAVMVILVAAHRRIELALGLGDGTALVAVALMVVGFIVFHEQERGRLLVERGIDWWTLLFFMFLFANAACLEFTGVTTKLGFVILKAAEAIARGGPGTPGVTTAATALLLLFSGAVSGFVDNLPVVAALSPVVKNLAQVGLAHSSILWWALLFGGCFGGNLTVVGSTANLVAVGAFERVTGKSVRFRDWIGVGALVTVATLAVALAGLLLQLPLAP